MSDSARMILPHQPIAIGSTQGAADRQAHYHDLQMMLSSINICLVLVYYQYKNKLLDTG